MQSLHPGRGSAYLWGRKASSLGPVVSALSGRHSLLDPCKCPILKIGQEQLLGFFFFLSPQLGSLFLYLVPQMFD